MELLIVRHAESKFNAKESNHLDSEITKLGSKQAIDVASFLKRKFDDINEWNGIVSPFLRTLQTAKAINDLTDLNFTVDWGVSEYGGGYSCRTEIEIPARKERFPEFFKGIDTNSWQMTTEPENIFFDRILKFIQQLKKDKKYVIVSHAMPIYTMIYILKGVYVVPKWDRRILNTTVTWIKNGEMKYFARYVNSGKDPRPDRDEILLF